MQLTANDFKTELEYLTYIVDYLDNFSKVERSHILARLEELQIIEARTSFLEYVKLMGPVLMPGFVMGRHIELIALRLEKLLHNAFKPSKDTPTDRWMLSLPPGGAKSQIVTRMFPSWALGVKPETRFIIVGHGIEFATDEYGAKIRDIMWSEEYKRIFPQTELRPDKQSAGRFLTTQGGEVLCTGIEAAVAGRRCGLNSMYVLDKELGYTRLDEVFPGAVIAGPNGWETASQVLANHQQVVYTVNQKLETSDDHPFYDQDGNLVRAKDLEVGMTIKGEPGWKQLQRNLLLKLQHILHGKP
jgi:hypothetical protein